MNLQSNNVFLPLVPTSLDRRTLGASDEKESMQRLMESAVVPLLPAPEKDIETNHKHHWTICSQEFLQQFQRWSTYEI